MPNDPQLDVVVKLKDMFTNQFRTMSGKTVQQSKAMERSFTGINRMAGRLKTTIVGLAGAYISYVGAQKLWSSVKEYAKLEAVEQGFKTLGKQIGATEDAIVQWNAAVKDTIGYADLYQQANKAIVSGLIKSQEEFTQLSEAAFYLARTFGQEVLPTMTQLLSSLEAGSPRALRTLGLDMEKIFEQERERTDAGGVLALEVKQRLMLEAILRKSADIQKTMTDQEKQTLTTLEKIQKTAVSFGDAQENIGKSVSGMADAMVKFSGEWERFTEATLPKFINLLKEALGVYNKLMRGSGAAGSATGDFLGQLYSFFVVGKESKLTPEQEKIFNDMRNKLWGLRALESSWKKAQRTYTIKGPRRATQKHGAYNRGTKMVYPPYEADTGFMASRERSEDMAEIMKAIKGHALEVETSWDRISNKINSGVQYYVDNTGSVLDQFSYAVSDTFFALENTLGTIFFDAMQGKMKSFKEYLRSFVNDITKILSQMLARQALGGIFSMLGFSPMATGGGGSFANVITPVGYSGVSSSLPLYGKAEGGIVNSPVVAGEAGPEAIVPLPDGRTIPVAMKGGGKVVNVNFNIRTNDAASFRSSLVQNKDTVSKIIQAAFGSDIQLRSAARTV